MRPGWYLHRLARMSPDEMVARLGAKARQRAWRRQWVTDATLDLQPVPDAVPAFASPLPPASRDVPAEARAALLLAADELLAGRWEVFARVREDMSPAPDWFADGRTGTTAPSGSYCFDIDHRDEAVVGNVKYVWELSRHHQCTVLAAAYHLTGDGRYAELAAGHLASWWTANPFLSGINWTSSIEAGVRLISWVWTRRLLDGWAGAGPLFEENPTFLRQLHHHQDYVATFLSHGSSANNHLIAETAGLFAAACAFPWFEETDGWRRAAQEHLEHEIGAQTFGSGLNRELAGGYHLFVLELCLAAALEGEVAGHPLAPAPWSTLARMSDALAAVVDGALRPPRQGDSDEGCGLLVDEPGFDRTAALLTTGRALFEGRPWWPDVAPRDVRTVLWTALVDRPRPVRVGRPDARPSVLADAGMTILREGTGAEEIWCRADAGPHGYLAIAAHAHADALSLEVRHGGVEILADPGTCCYHGEPEWRSYFRSTLGHNTLEVAATDQSRSRGPFLWDRHASSWVEHLAGLGDGPTLEWHGAHDGYRALDPPAVHHRVVRLERAARRLVVRDWLESRGPHECRLAFHLGPDVACELDGSAAHLQWPSPDGPRRATLALPRALRWTRAAGQVDPPLGWYSPRFDVRVPAVTLVGSGRVAGGQELLTSLAFQPILISGPQTAVSQTDVPQTQTDGGPFSLEESRS